VEAALTKPRASRVLRLAAWLRLEADKEEGTARALSQIPQGNPEPCTIKARLLREIADQMEATVSPQPNLDP
jgi:hypothetical protein